MHKFIFYVRTTFRLVRLFMKMPEFERNALIDSSKRDLDYTVKYMMYTYKNEIFGSRNKHGPL